MNTFRLLVDTGVFLSAADRDEPSHHICVDLLAQYANSLTTTAPVVAETAWLIESRLGPGAESLFLTMIVADSIDVIDLEHGDYQRCIALINTYDDLGLGLVDASIIAVAERLNQTTIATLNHRDFTVVRPNHTNTFELLPGRTQ